MELVTNPIGQVIIGLLVGINLIAFVLMGRDKHKSYNEKVSHRIPEGLIFFWATLFGGVGVYVGMLVFRHKTKKWYFKLGIPLLMLQNAATVYLALDFFLFSQINF